MLKNDQKKPNKIEVVSSGMKEDDINSDILMMSEDAVKIMSPGEYQKTFLVHKGEYFYHRDGLPTTIRAAENMYRIIAYETGMNPIQVALTLEYWIKIQRVYYLKFLTLQIPGIGVLGFKMYKTKKKEYRIVPELYTHPNIIKYLRDHFEIPDELIDDYESTHDEVEQQEREEEISLREYQYREAKEELKLAMNEIASLNRKIMEMAEENKAIRLDTKRRILEKKAYWEQKLKDKKLVSKKKKKAYAMKLEAYRKAKLRGDLEKMRSLFPNRVAKLEAGHSRFIEKIRRRYKVREIRKALYKEYEENWEKGLYPNQPEKTYRGFMAIYRARLYQELEKAGLMNIENYKKALLIKLKACGMDFGNYLTK